MKQAALAQIPKRGEPPLVEGKPWLYHHQTVLAAASEWGKAVAPRDSIAQAIASLLVRMHWKQQTGSRLRMPWPWPIEIGKASPEVQACIRRAANALRGRSVLESAYRISLLYTDLLSKETRSSRGIYYTPPMLAERLLDIASGAGVDWSTVTALDPACGGGAFLVPVAERILAHEHIKALPPIDRLLHLESHLEGFEIDGFAAWMTRAFLDLLAFPVSHAADRHLDVPIHVADALNYVCGDHRRFDLVVGNPPYTRVTLPMHQRAIFSRSLYGHANLYGIFLDAALRWRKPTGLIAFITPTSLLGGQYYSRLRDLLLDESPPLAIDLVSDRTRVFSTVQQETCLTVFGADRSRMTTVHLIEPKSGHLEVSHIGAFPLASERRKGPWFLPRSQAQALLVKRAIAMDVRLETLGFRASTGPLVWNRAKQQIRANPEPGTYPLIWAEGVRADGFSFDYKARSGRRFIKVGPEQEHLLTTQPCVLVRRVTAKEQPRRLIACAVPESFFAEWGAIVVENHVNVIWNQYPAKLSPKAIAAILNTAAVDEVFRCLSGSVSVSATEIHSIPLPDTLLLERIEEMCKSRKDHAAIEKLMAEAYGLA